MKLKRIVALLLCIFIVSSVSATALTEAGDVIVDLVSSNHEMHDEHSECDSTCDYGDSHYKDVPAADSLVGRTARLNSGVYVYKEANLNSSKHYCLFSYDVEILEEIVVDSINWYRFSANGFLGTFYSSYCYVVASDIVFNADNLDENGMPLCDCGYAGNGGLDAHNDACARKHYLRYTYIVENTAEEIYADWATLDAETRTAVLTFLSWDNYTKYSELLALIEGGTTEPDPTEEPQPTEEPETTLPDGTTVSVSGAPSGSTLQVTSPASSYNYNQELDDPEFGEELFCYDITIFDADGNEWQPDNAPVQVTLTLPELNIAEDSKVRVAHFHDDEVSYTDAIVDLTNNTITFETDGFSVFYFYLVFAYNGYEFVLSGGGEIYLSELFVSLGIERTVDEVADVTFSDETLLQITQVGEDWLLTSLGSFGSNECLTITFIDGKVIEIKVTDPVVFNYILDGNTTDVEKLPTANYSVGNVSDGDSHAQGKQYLMNTNVITKQNIIDSGTTTATDTAVHMVIYVKEGMAVRFEAGTVWDNDTSRPTYAGNDIWFWSWDSTYNYVVVKDGNGSRHTTFPVHAPNASNTQYYCNITLVVIDNEDGPTLLEDALANASDLNSNYSIRNVPVTLYNYDGAAFNDYYYAQNGNFLAFSSVSQGVDPNTGHTKPWSSTDNGGSANSGGGVALMGIIQNTLTDGLPRMSQGQQVDLFSTNPISGKTVFSDVGFQFIYNEETGYFTYNSALNHAQYVAESNEIQLYRESLAVGDTIVAGAQLGNSGFYPFADINSAFDQSSGSTMAWSQWEAALTDPFELIPADYARDIVGSTSLSPKSQVDMHFGIQMAADFYLPEDKKLFGKDMVYKFTGDDDLWVFIDGKLVLDIGGGHTYVSGSFNLTTGEVWVEKYTKLSAANGGSYANQEQGTDLRYTDSFITGLKGDQMHTIQIFYLERHSGVSNCYMHFNLPLVPVNGVEVSKELLNQNGEELSVTPDQDYTFCLYSAKDDDDVIDAVDFVPLANTTYYVYGAGAPTAAQATDENGCFKLKAGQRASFEGIERFTEVYALECEIVSDYIYTEHKVSVNKGDLVAYTLGEPTSAVVIQKDGRSTFDFINYMQTQPLSIEKEVVGGLNGLFNAEQEFIFTLDFENGILETEAGAIHAIDKTQNAVYLTDGGTFTLQHDEGITIPRVPVNMGYALSESNPDTTANSFISPTFKLMCGEGVTETQCEFGTSFNETVKNGFENSITVINQQLFGLKITKKITDSTNPDQSFSFDITGDNGYKLRVVIPASEFVDGSADITISGLKYGTYTITETVWASRYTLKDITANHVLDAVVSDSSITFVLTPNGQVIFENERTEKLWLIGDCYVENLYLTTGIDNGKDDYAEGGN